MSGMLHVCVSIVLSPDSWKGSSTVMVCAIDKAPVLHNWIITRSSFNVTRMRLDSYYAMVSDCDVRRA